MTDTTEQQAVTVAQEDREAACAYLSEIAGLRGGDAVTEIRDDHPTLLAFARHRLASVSSASAEGVSDALAMQDDDVVGWAVAMVAKGGPHEWGYRDPVDGTFISDPWPFHAAEYLAKLSAPDAASPEPVPATNQAGEVDWIEHDGSGCPVDADAMVDVRFAGYDSIRVEPYIRYHERWDQEASSVRWTWIEQRYGRHQNDVTHYRLSAAALATQPATSQEGEACAFVDCPPGLFRWQGIICFKSEYSSKPGQQDAYCVSSGEYFWGGTSGDLAARRALTVTPLAATPTPPTLSEDLRAAIQQALQCTPSVSSGADGFDEPHIVYDCGDPWEILRAALARAQVKAS